MLEHVGKLSHQNLCMSFLQAGWTKVETRTVVRLSVFRLLHVPAGTSSQDLQPIGPSTHKKAFPVTCTLLLWEDKDQVTGFKKILTGDLNRTGFHTRQTISCSKELVEELKQSRKIGAHLQVSSL